MDTAVSEAVFRINERWGCSPLAVFPRGTGPIAREIFDTRILLLLDKLAQVEPNMATARNILSLVQGLRLKEIENPDSTAKRITKLDIANVIKAYATPRPRYVQPRSKSSGRRSKRMDSLDAERRDEPRTRARQKSNTPSELSSVLFTMSSLFEQPGTRPQTSRSSQQAESVVHQCAFEDVKASPIAHTQFSAVTYGTLISPAKPAETPNNRVETPKVFSSKFSKSTAASKSSPPAFTPARSSTSTSIFTPRNPFEEGTQASRIRDILTGKMTATPSRSM